MPFRILLTHTPQSRRQYYGEKALHGLRQAGEVILHEADDALNPAALVEAARDVEVIVADRLTAAPSQAFTSLPKLRAIVRCAVDIRNIDVEAASRSGVLVTRASPGFVQSVSELAVGFMVDLARGVSRATADYHAGNMPEVAIGRQLAGSTIGIIGYGSIGRYLAHIAQALGMRVLVSDPFVAIDDMSIEQLQLDELLRRSDYVVCLVVANKDTENLIGAAQLALMQPHACFVNLSRGELVDEAALLAALRDMRIAGAAMDVGRARDQMPSAALARLPNVIATPHRWPDTARDRTPGAGDGASGADDRERRSADWCRQRGAVDQTALKSSFRGGAQRRTRSAVSVDSGFDASHCPGMMGWTAPARHQSARLAMLIRPDKGDRPWARLA